MGHFGRVDGGHFSGARPPVTGVAGDQQAALFGQGCVEAGMAKNTYGTGSFILLNTGKRPVRSRNGLLSTVAWAANEELVYALEGSIFVAGAAVQWLRDGLGIISSSAESEALASSVPDTGGVYIVPAFVGLGAPHWDMYARGTILGLTRGTTGAHIARATIESLAFRVRDVLDAMQADSHVTPTVLRVDGGASANDLLMQFQADILGIPVERPHVLESTARGAALLARSGAGLSASFAAVPAGTREFTPQMQEAEREERYRLWTRAVQRARSWVEPG
jgi:glycerol kinase